MTIEIKATRIGVVYNLYNLVPINDETTPETSSVAMASIINKSLMKLKEREQTFIIFKLLEIFYPCNIKTTIIL